MIIDTQVVCHDHKYKYVPLEVARPLILSLIDISERKACAIVITRVAAN